MLAAFALPYLLEHIPDRQVMLSGAALATGTMAIAAVLSSTVR